MRRSATLVLATLLLVAGSPAWAQMVETFKDDQRSLTSEVVMDVYFCEQEGGFSFSLHDMRVNPRERIFPKYEIRGLEATTGKMKRAGDDRVACAGAPDVSVTSEAVTVKPIPVPEEEDFLWVLNLRLEGNRTLSVAVSQQGLPFKASILYHPETKMFEVQQ